MDLPVVYVWTHDSIGLGGDGPTHQPVEHLAALRAMPRLRLIRPADGPETAEAWRAAIARTDGPTALALSRQDLPPIDRSVHASADGLHRGAYVLADADGGQARLLLIATGSEVWVALRLEPLGGRARRGRLPRRLRRLRPRLGGAGEVRLHPRERRRPCPQAVGTA
jgi:transketolase